MKSSRELPIRAIGVALLAATGGWGAPANSGAEDDKTASGEKPKPSAEDLAWIDDLTSGPPGEHADLKPVTVEFNLSWNNVLNAGELEFTLDRKTDAKIDPGEIYVGTAEGRSSGLARVLWPYDVEAKALVDSGSLRPHLFELSETERGKSVNYLLDFQPGRVVSDTTVLPKKKSEEAETRRKVYRYDPLHDVLSLALYVRSFDLAEGDTVSALVSPFNRPYHVEFEMAGKEKRKIRREKYDTIKFDIVIRKVNSDKTLQAYDKMKEATIWFTDDEYRLPMEVHADIFVGFVSARMTERHWLEDGKPAEEAADAPGKKGQGGLKQFFKRFKKDPPPDADGTPAAGN